MQFMREYETGTLVKIEAKFYDADDLPYDPSTISLEIVEPDGTKINKSKADMENPSTGVYHYYYKVTKEGIHRYRCTGETGTTYSEAATLRLYCKDSLA